jgi:hypothetical protein
MSRRGWCKSRAVKAVRKGADIPVEIRSGIEKRDRPGVTKEERCECGKKTGENAA